MANKLPLVLDSTGNVQQLQSTDILQVTELLIGPPGTQAATMTFLVPYGFWLDLPTSGPSGIGNGGAGNNTWLGYCHTNGDWCSNSIPGDLAYRNLGGRLLWGTSTGPYQLMLDTAGLTVATPTSFTSTITVPTVTSGDNSTNAASTAFVQNAITNSGASNNLVYAGNVGVTSGNTQIPFGNTAPLITGGTQLWSQTLNPPSTTSKFFITFSGMIDSSNSNTNITISLFRNNTLIGFITSNIATANKPEVASLSVLDSPNTTAAITYSCRIGIGSAATWYIGRASTSTMGGVNNSGWSIWGVI